VFSLKMSLTTPLIFQVHAVSESIALCWPASIEGQVLEQFCHQKRLQTFANETGSGFKIQDSRSKKNFLNPGARIRRVSGFKKCFLNLES